jgi:hypothetical protein
MASKRGKSSVHDVMLKKRHQKLIDSHADVHEKTTKN